MRAVVKLFLGVCGALAICAGHLAVAASFSGLIVPGQSLGGVGIGMARPEVLATFGNPNRTIGPTQHGPGWIFKYENPKLYATYLSIVFSRVPDDAVVDLETGSPDFRTKEGIGVGSTGSDLTRAYGSQFKRMVFQMDGVVQQISVCYDQLGFSASLNPTNVVQFIHVYAPNATGPCGAGE